MVSAKIIARLSSSPTHGSARILSFLLWSPLQFTIAKFCSNPCKICNPARAIPIHPAIHLSPPPQPVIALTFFALFSHPSPSLDPYDFTTLSLFLYPNNHLFTPFLFISPFHTSQEQDEMAHGLLLTIHYWYMRIGIAIVERPFTDPVDPPDTPHTNSGASSFPHSHDGLSNGPGPKEERRRSPSSSDRGTNISRVQPSPSKEPLQQFSMSRAERSSLLSRTLASNSLLTLLRFKKTSCLPAKET